MPKGGSKYWKIGLLEPILKVLEVIVDWRLNVENLHGSLCGFQSSRGMGTVTISTKIAIQLAYLEQYSLYGVFLDLRKAFDAMDWPQYLAIL